MTSFDSDKIAEIHRRLHSDLPSEPALRAKALETVLVEKGLLAEADINKWVDLYSEKIGPKNGAKIVARAWVDPGYRGRLIADAPAAVEELGLKGGELLQAVENTDRVHNLVVCTLCSCYPMGLLGTSPAWYKSNDYRARAVRDPRGVLQEFGVEIDYDVEIRIWDSTSERRFMVVPRRPKGTEGWSEEALSGLVTRNSLIGTHRDLSPKEG